MPTKHEMRTQIKTRQAKWPAKMIPLTCMRGLASILSMCPPRESEIRGLDHGGAKCEEGRGILLARAENLEGCRGPRGTCGCQVQFGVDNLHYLCVFMHTAIKHCGLNL